MNSVCQRVVAHRQIAGAVAEHVQPVVAQAGKQCLGRVDAHVCGAEFDGQRQAVQFLANPLDDALVGWEQVKVRIAGSRTCGEERSRSSQGEGCDPKALFAAQVQPLAAGDDDAHARTG